MMFNKRARLLIAGGILSFGVISGGAIAAASNKDGSRGIDDKPHGYKSPPPGPNIYECVEREKNKPKDQRLCDKSETVDSIDANGNVFP